MSVKKDLTFLVKEENQVMLTEGVLDKIGRAVKYLMGKKGEIAVDDLMKSNNQVRDAQAVARKIITDINSGKIKLKNTRDADQFKIVAIESGLFSTDGSSKVRSDNEISKHVEFIIANNLASQIKNSGPKDYFLRTFIPSTMKDDFCGI